MAFSENRKFLILSEILRTLGTPYMHVIIIFVLTASLLAIILYRPYEVTGSTIQELENLAQDGKHQEFTNNTFLENPTVEAIVEAVSNGIPLSYYHSPKSGDLVLKERDWTIERLHAQYPDAIEKISSGSSEEVFLIKKSIIIEKNAVLNIRNSKILLQSFSNKDNKPSILITYGNTEIVNSTVMSWDPQHQRPDPNPYHPRSFLVAKDGGIMNIISSEITYLGFSLGGALSTESALAALNYYNTSDFVITNSTLNHNLYGFYSNESSNFKIINNQVYDQVGYGLDPHTGSKDFIIHSNRIFANGRQGIICSFRCENVTITNNIVEHNIEGIGLHWLTNSSLIKNNTVKYNKEFGIFVKTDSYNNLIEQNTVLGNGYGIGMLENSDNNIIRHNLLIGNILAEEQIYEDDSSDSNLIENNEVRMY
jgi:mannuronan 5-epimerase